MKIKLRMVSVLAALWFSGSSLASDVRMRDVSEGALDEADAEFKKPSAAFLHALDMGKAQMGPLEFQMAKRREEIFLEAKARGEFPSEGGPSLAMQKEVFEEVREEFKGPITAVNNCASYRERALAFVSAGSPRMFVETQVERFYAIYDLFWGIEALSPQTVVEALEKGAHRHFVTGESILVCNDTFIHMPGGKTAVEHAIDKRNSLMEKADLVRIDAIIAILQKAQD